MDGDSGHSSPSSPSPTSPGASTSSPLNRSSATSGVSSRGVDRRCGLALVAVTEQMFSDGAVNWGRVVSLFAFLKCWTDYLKAHGRADTPTMTYIVQVSNGM